MQEEQIHYNRQRMLQEEALRVSILDMTDRTKRDQLAVEQSRNNLMAQRNMELDLQMREDALKMAREKNSFDLSEMKNSKEHERKKELLEIRSESTAKVYQHI
jgi:hypothetical protein